MNIKTKQWRRGILLAVIFVGLCIAAVGALVVRRYVVAAQFETYRREGLEAARAGNPDLAIERLGRFFRRHPDNIEALECFAQQLELASDSDHLRDRIVILRRLVELQPDNIEHRHALLKLYLQAGLNTEALDTCAQINAKSPKDLQAARSRVIVLGRLRRFDEALAECIRFNTAFPQEIEIQLLTLSIMHLRNQPVAQITARADQLLKEHPSDPRFELIKSFALGITDDIANSKVWAIKTAAHTPSDPAFILILQKQLDGLELFDESFALLERSFKSAPTNPELKQMLAARLFQTGRWKDVIAVTDDVHPVSPSNVEADILAIRALAQFQSGAGKDAQPILDLLSHCKSNPNATVWAKILSTIAPSTSIDPKHILQYCQSALERFPANPYFHYFAAKAFLRVGENDLAISHYKSAAILAPAWNLPLVETSRLLTAAGQGPNALALATAARNRAPDEINTLVALAMAMASTTPFDQADKHPELLKLIEQIQRQSPGEEQTLPIQIMMLAQSGQRDNAIAIVRKTLATTPPPSEQSLLQLSATCHDIDPKLQDQCLTRYKEIYGMTPDLAMTIARNLLTDSHPQEGLKSLETARAGAHKGDDLSWRLIWARYLDLIQDSRAKDAWIALGDETPDNMQVQWLALSARSVQADHAFVGRTIDRLQKLAGDQGTNWRLARARWLIGGTPTNQETSEATALLNEVSRSAPDLLAPRLLLAECLERSGNISGAIDQLMAAVSISPQSKGLALELVRLLQSQGDFERARPYLDTVLQSRSLTALEVRRAAVLLVQQGDSTRALQLVQAAFGTDPAKQPADVVLAGLYRIRNQPERAEGIYKKLLEKPDTSIIAIAASFYADQKRNDEAARILALLDKVEPNVATRELILGDHYLQHGKSDVAILHYKAAVQASPENLVAWRRIINFNLAIGKADVALATAHEALRSVPTDPLLSQFVQRPTIITDAASDASLRPFLLSLLYSSPDSIASYEVLDLLLTAKKDKTPLEQTVGKVRTLADRYPRLLPLQSWMAQTYVVLKNVEDAVSIGTRTMQTFPIAPEPAEIAAGALAGAGRWSEVLQVAKEWRERLLTQPMPADEMIAAAYLGLGDSKNALAQLQPYLSQATAEPESYSMLLGLYARGLLIQGDPDVTARFLRPMMTKSAAVRTMWSQIASVMRDIPQAKAWLTEAQTLAESGSFDAKVTAAVGWQRLSMRTPDAQIRQTAQRVLDAALKDSETAKDVSASDLQSLAVLEEAVPNPTVAEAIYRRALKLNPDLAIAQNNLAMLLVRQNQHLDEALKLASQAVQQNPKVANFADTLSSVYGAMKNYDQALTSINSAVRLEPAGLEWQLHRIEIFADSGQSDKAKQALTKMSDSIQADGGSPSPQVRDRMSAIKRQLGIKSSS